MKRRPVVASVLGVSLFVGVYLVTSAAHLPHTVYLGEAILAGIAGGFLAGL